MLKVLLGAAMVLAPVPAIPETASIPADPIARAKFPHDKPETVDALALFNKAVNASMTYASDKEHYGIDDHYVSMPKDGKGDCEDYALSKMETLSGAGVPVIAITKLVMVVIKAKDGKYYGHAILAYQLPSKDVAYLDMGGEPMTRKELEARGYKFFDWKA